MATLKVHALCAIAGAAALLFGALVVVVSVVRVTAWEVATYQGHGQFALRFEAQ
jgi:hypothetical protein